MILTGILAWDPGGSGGACFASADCWRTHAMPDNPHEVADLFRSYYDLVQVVAIERVGGYVGKMQTGSSMFRFGHNAGVLFGCAAMSGKRVEFPTPQTWQGALGCGSRATYGGTDDSGEWKRHLKGIAARLHPELKPTLKTADAILIAEWAVRHMASMGYVFGKPAPIEKQGELFGMED